MRKILMFFFVLGFSLAAYAKEPILKAEGDYQKLMTDIQGFRFSAEAGLILIRVNAEYTRYTEDNPAGRYEIFAAHLSHSLSLGDLIRIQALAGYKKFFNGVQNSGLDIGTAVYVSPAKKWEAEAKTFFSFVNTNNDRTIPDLRVGLRYKIGLLGLRAGYRYIRIRSRDWQGPYFGLAFEI